MLQSARLLTACTCWSTPPRGAPGSSVFLCWVCSKRSAVLAPLIKQHQPSSSGSAPSSQTQMQPCNGGLGLGVDSAPAEVLGADWPPVALPSCRTGASCCRGCWLAAARFVRLHLWDSFSSSERGRVESSLSGSQGGSLEEAGRRC